MHVAAPLSTSPRVDFALVWHFHWPIEIRQQFISATFCGCEFTTAMPRMGMIVDNTCTAELAKSAGTEPGRCKGWITVYQPLSRLLFCSWRMEEHWVNVLAGEILSETRLSELWSMDVFFFGGWFCRVRNGAEPGRWLFTQARINHQIYTTILVSSKPRGKAHIIFSRIHKAHLLPFCQPPSSPESVPGAPSHRFKRKRTWAPLQRTSRGPSPFTLSLFSLSSTWQQPSVSLVWFKIQTKTKTEQN
jgi:hypothetical protein